MKSPCAPSTLLSLALLLVVVVEIAHAAQWIEKVTENPMYPKHCKDRKFNRYFANSATWYDRKQCLQQVCQFPYIVTSSCGSVMVEPPCTLVSDNTKLYPECCPEPKCPSLPNDEPGDFNTI